MARLLIFVLMCVILRIHNIETAAELPSPPNIIIILADDLGYGDLATYGHPIQEPGAIDDLAAEGIKFTQFYSADSMCSPSRAGLLTGQLPIRLGVVGGRRVFVPKDKGGLRNDVATLPKELAKLQYFTGMVGKWHLGINALNSSDGSHLPGKHGFEYVGTNLPMSVLWECDESGIFMPDGPDPTLCYLYKGDSIIQQPIKFEKLTATLVDDFVNFLNEAPSDRPFFFYFSFPHVHAALWASEQFKNSSRRGLFGNNVNELHWAIGQMMTQLKNRQLDENTLVIFLSDHGPHKEICTQGGETAGLKGGKSNSYEGGFRIPTIARWKGTIPAGVTSHAVLSSLDLFPTLMNIAGAKDYETLDGVEVGDYLVGAKLDNGDELMDKRPIFYYCNKHLMAVRYKQYKVHYFTSPIFSQDSEFAQMKCPHGRPIEDWYTDQTCDDSKLEEHNPPLVYDLNEDAYERYILDVEECTLKATLKLVNELVMKHKQSVVKVADLLGNYDDNVVPCCDPPKCTCNYYGED